MTPPPVTLYVLEHRTCGHIAGADTERAGMEAQHALLAAGGYHLWRVRRAAADEFDRIVTAILADERCPTCAIDPGIGRTPEVKAAAAEFADLGPAVVVTPHPEVAIMPGACLPHQVDAMRTQTHDGLLEVIAEDGATAIGRVEWRQWQGRDNCRTVLHGLYEDETRPIKAFGLDQFDAFFDEYPDDCVLIVASCPVVKAAT